MPKDSKAVAEAEATEIIELAIDDIELLGKAFDVIALVCEEMNAELDTEESVTEPTAESEKIVLN